MCCAWWSTWSFKFSSQKGPAADPPLLNIAESAGANAVGGINMDHTLHSARGGDKEDSVDGLAEPVAGVV